MRQVYPRAACGAINLAVCDRASGYGQSEDRTLLDPRRTATAKACLRSCSAALVGSTALSPRLDPEDLLGHITAYAALLTRNGGFVGGLVLTYFGYLWGAKSPSKGFVG